MKTGPHAGLTNFFYPDFFYPKSESAIIKQYKDDPKFKKSIKKYIFVQYLAKHAH